MDKVALFCKLVTLSKQLDVVHFDTIKEVACALPTSRKREDKFPEKEEEVRAHLVVPPRSEWDSKKWWDHCERRFLRNKRPFFVELALDEID